MDTGEWTERRARLDVGADKRVIRGSSRLQIARAIPVRTWLRPCSPWFRGGSEECLRGPHDPPFDDDVAGSNPASATMLNARIRSVCR